MVFNQGDSKVRMALFRAISVVWSGGRRPFRAEESSAAYTALAVKVLLLSDAISRDSLNECE